MLKNILLLAYLVGCVLAAPQENVSQQEELVLLGTAADVTYYAGHVELSWEAGKQLCQSHNLTLAEVHNSEQEAFLKEALTNLDEFSHYHTGGRVRVGLDSLVWYNSGAGVEVISDVDINEEVRQCLLIRVPDYETLWDTHACTDVWPPVCQSA